MSTVTRVDIYIAIHKALRSQMCAALGRIGRMDTGDDTDLAAGLAELEALLATCASHLEHENDFVHAAIEARAPAGSCAATAGDHREHVEEIAHLRAMAAALPPAPAAKRQPLALALYQALALFVADNFQHMQVEETRNAGLLWDHYTDAEILGIQGRLLASLSPQQHLDNARWMVPAATPFERSCMFKDMQEKMPPEALLGLLAHVQPHLDLGGWTQLSQALKVPQVPGLVQMGMRIGSHACGSGLPGSGLSVAPPGRRLAA